MGHLGVTYKIIVIIYNFYGTHEGHACRNGTLTLEHDAADDTVNQKTFLYYTKMNHENSCGVPEIPKIVQLIYVLFERVVKYELEL